MNIQKYLTNLKDESHEIFTESLKYQSELGKVHHLSSCIYEFSDHINDPSEKNILISRPCKIHMTVAEALYTRKLRQYMVVLRGSG